MNRTVPSPRRQFRQRLALSAAAVILLALAACNPAINAYRDMRGISKDDPNPKTAPFTQNLATAEAQPYPNLATVPPPPIRALSAAQRRNLTESLVAERGKVETTDEKLRAGQILGWKPPPAPPPLPPGAAAGNPPVPAGQRLAASPGTGLRKHGAPPDTQPRESSLAPPRIASLPQPEAATRSPGRPRLPPAPAPAPAPPLPATIAASGFQPPPPPPKLGANATPVVQSPPAASQPAETVEIGFSGTSAALDKTARAAVERIVALYRRHAPKTKIRIIGYAGAGGGSAAELKSFQLALDRAQAVAAALERAGVPAKTISAEAAPTRTPAQRNRAEARLEN